MKFHIRGADLDTYKKNELEKLRWMIANLLRVPPDFVIVSGIEPSKSLLITFMVQDYIAERIVSLQPKSLTVLAEMFVTDVTVDEHSIKISGKTQFNHFVLSLIWYNFLHVSTY